MAFENIIGNEKIKKILEQAVYSNQVVHSYLFVGIQGIGKSLIAKEFSKMLLCLKEEGKPCENCKSCLEIEGDNHPDFHYISKEGTIKIEDIRYLQTKIAEKPILSSRKIYVIENSEQMTKEAQNCLLKTLEEPPEYITIILLTNNENAILNTIKSRCMKLYFQKISDSDLAEYLERNYDMTNISKAMIETYGGSIGKALQLRDKTAMYQEVQAVLDRMEHTNILEIWNQAEVIYNKEEILNILDYMNVYFYDLLKQPNNDKIGYAKCISLVEEAKRNLNTNSNFDMTIDYLLMRIWEEVNS